MKTAVSLTALLAGLCAACAAAPLSKEFYLRPEPAISEPFLNPLSEPLDHGPQDFDVDFDSSEQFFPATSLGDIPVAEISFDDVGFPGSVRVPEPPSFLSLGFALLLIAVLGIWRLNYRPRKRRRHRQMRPLTVLR
jgi:hypothetical protein